jgi:hypothetical protein
LPRPLATDLNECELEDVLCIYKDCFEKALAQHHNSCKRKG